MCVWSAVRVCDGDVFVCVSAAGAGVSSVVRVLPQRRAAFTALHSAVSARAGVELPVGDGGTRSALQRLHRGASARHLQPGECPQLTHHRHHS